MRSGVDGMG